MHTKTLKTGIRVQRYFIYLAYDGTNYHGWQIQPNGISVQEVAEMVGYNDIPTFRKHFVDAFGTTPSTYE